MLVGAAGRGGRSEVAWALDFRFGSTVGGRAVTNASGGIGIRRWAIAHRPSAACTHAHYPVACSIN